MVTAIRESRKAMKAESNKEGSGRYFIKLDSKQIDKDINIKSVYNEMYEKLEAIKEGLRGSNSPTGESLSNKIDNIQSGIRFLNDINSHSTYIQIPINIMDKKTNCELYILKRIRSGKK
jgi:Cu/Ag efflux pump CusA